MTSSNQVVKDVAKQEYKYGFVTQVDEEKAPLGLTEDTVRWISNKKQEPSWMLDWRLQAYDRWKKMAEPTLSLIHI